MQSKLQQMRVAVQHDRAGKPSSKEHQQCGNINVAAAVDQASARAYAKRKKALAVQNLQW